MQKKVMRLIPQNTRKVHSLRKQFVFALLLTLAVSFDTCAEAFDAIALSVSGLSEPAERGLSEANGRPALAAALDWDIANNWTIGASGYVATDAPAPQRPQGILLYGGWRWVPETGPDIDISLLHRMYPGDFQIDWDHSEVRIDVHFSRNLAATFQATDDYYGIGGTSLGGSLTVIRDITGSLYARAKAGGVSIDDNRFDDYAYIEVGAGYSLNRWNLEVLLRASTADVSPAFTDSQTNAFVTAILSYKVR